MSHQSKRGGKNQAKTNITTAKPSLHSKSGSTIHIKKALTNYQISRIVASVILQKKYVETQIRGSQLNKIDKIVRSIVNMLSNR